MIEILQHREEKVSHDIRAVFQASYAIEAALLKAVDFPPLKRPLEAFVHCDNVFLGYWKDEALAGVVEVAQDETATHIQSLVVHPDFFRQGIARKLMRSVFDSFPSELFTVETGVDNGPACQLYKKLGFVEVKQWDTDHGVRKVRFEKM